MRIKKVHLSFFYKLAFDELLIEDRQKDTLLFAGSARVNVNDWFFTKDKVIIHSAELSNGVINLKRSGPEWNYQFLSDYFSSTKPDKEKEQQIEIDFKKLRLENFRFNMIDKWVGEDMIAYVEKLSADIQRFDLNQQQIIIDQINLAHPLFRQNDYTGLRPADYKPAVKKTPAKKSMGWQISLGRLFMEEGIYQNERESDRIPYTKQFDENHISFEQINGTLKNIQYKGDSVIGHIALSSKEKSGLIVKQLNSRFKFTPEIMEFNDLDLVTNRSHLKNYYSMRYKSFNSDMKNFITNVKLEGRFTDSEVSSDDIAIFAPELQSWHRNFILNGEATGTIEHLSIRNTRIKTGRSVVTGDAELYKIYDTDAAIIDYKTNELRTNDDDLGSIVPALKNIPELQRLGDISFKGNFKGTYRDFKTSGLFTTQLGSIQTDVALKIPDKGIPVYEGIISGARFNLGKLIDRSDIGNVSLNGRIKGNGFTLNQLNTNFDGNVSEFGYRQYIYRNIQVRGDFNNKEFNGFMSVNDPNLEIKKLEGRLNLSQKDPAFNIKADVSNAQLKNIGFTDKNISLKGQFDLNFTGNNIDNFLGTAKVSNALISNQERTVEFDSFSLESAIDGEKKLLTLHSNEIDASIAGKFRIMELPNAFKVFLHKYYPAYIKEPAQQYSEQHFDFNLNTRNIEPYLKIYDSKLSGFNFSSIIGNLDLTNYELNAKADIPAFGYGDKKFSDLFLTSSGNKDTLNTTINVGEAILHANLKLPNSKLLLTSHNDITEVHLKTTTESTLTDADLNASIQTFTDGVKMNFYPSSFIVNENKWLLDKDGELTIRNKLIDAKEIKISHDEQVIKITSEKDPETDETNILAAINQLDLQDFFPLLFSEPEVKGKISGTARIKDPMKDILVDFKGNADSLLLDDKYIGDIDFDANGNIASGAIRFKAGTTDTANDFIVEGTYNLKDTSGKQLDANLYGKKIQLSILEPYLSDVFSKIDGTATSDLKISGSPQHKYLTGNVTVNKGFVEVDYTRCRYYLEDQKIIFGKDFIDLGLTKIKDSLNNTATVSGKIRHQLFDDFLFDNIKLETAKLLLLNTGKKDNSAFYGKIIGRAKMELSGPISNLEMNIEGEPSILDSSHIYLPDTEEKESNSLDYIEFTKYGSEMEETKTSQKTNIIVNLSIKANPACQVDVILDEETGDIVKGQGNGRINIRVGNIEPLSIRGTYQLSKGEYTFNFQTFLKKPFTLNNGSITWSGDPYQAIIDIDAEYLAKNVDISSLSAGGGFKQKEDVKIISHLTGILQKPLVKFDFELPERSDAKRNDIIVKRLADFKNDDNEMNKQVASLLLFNSFIVGNQNFLSQGNASTLITNTIGGMISNLLTGFLNKELEKATNGILSTYIDINPTLDLQKSAAQLQANVRAGLKILFSNRLVVLVGGNLDYNNSLYVQQLDRKGLLTPDINVEWLVNKEGSVRVVGFNRSSIDFTLNQRNRSGLQLSYRKDMNRLSDIFKPRKKMDAEDNVQRP